MEVECIRTIRPNDAHYRHRLSISYPRRPSIVIERKKNIPAPQVEAETQPTDPVTTATVQTNHRNHRLSSSSAIFDNDEEFEEYLDAELGETCPLSQSHDVFEDPVITTYKLACKKFNVIPNKCAMKGLLQQTLKCRYNSIDNNAYKSICCALLDNRFVEKLEFQQNDMGPGPAVMFADVISESSFLTHIKIADNKLKSYGAKVICEAVAGNKLIRSLDLSGNGLVESDGEHFRKLLSTTETLRELYLGHNELMDSGVRSISQALKNSICLRVLDLSWNHIRLQGAVAIGEALAKNSSLESINLAWNGLYIEGAKSIAEALEKNSTLESLNLTCNRLNEYCIAQLLGGLSKNSTLETLRLGQNQVTTKGALTILEQIKSNTNSGIKVIDFGKQEVHDTFETVYNEMKSERDIEVLYGEVWKTDRSTLQNSGESDDEVALLCCNPLVVLMECMRLQNLRLIDFFKSLDTDKSNLICINELCDGMLKVGVPIRRATLLRLLHKLDTDGNQRLDYGEMVEAQNKHRKYLRSVLADTKIDFDKTEIGKVSLLLRKVMGRNFIMRKDDSDRHRRNRSTSRPSTAKSGESGAASNLGKLNRSTAERSSGSSRVSSSSSIYKRGGSASSNKSSSSGKLGVHLNKLGPNTSRRSSIASNESGVFSRPGSGSSIGSNKSRDRLPNIDSESVSTLMSSGIGSISPVDSPPTVRNKKQARPSSVPLYGGVKHYHVNTPHGSSVPPIITVTPAGHGRKLSRS